jgi:hypothetical protein
MLQCLGKIEKGAIMDYLTIFEAAKQSGVSDKTLRRAIENGKLATQPRLYKNQPVMIAVADLESYCVSRQEKALTRRVHTQRLDVPQNVSSRLVELETRVQQLEGLVSTLTSQSSRQGMYAEPTTSRQLTRHMPSQIEPVELGKFADLHGISRQHAREGFYEYRLTHKLQPYELEDTYLLNAHEQRVFYVRNRGYGHTWRECEACPHEVDESTSLSRKPSDFHPDAIVKGLPDGCMGIRDFARQHGVSPTTFVHHIINGIGKEKVSCTERPRAGRSEHTERYLTPEQQQAALDYWRRHGVKFTD